MSKEPDRKNPRWDMVNALYDYIDDGIVKISEMNKSYRAIVEIMSMLSGYGLKAKFLKKKDDEGW